MKKKPKNLKYFDLQGNKQKVKRKKFKKMLYSATGTGAIARELNCNLHTLQSLITAFSKIPVIDTLERVWKHNAIAANSRDDRYISEELNLEN